MNLSRFVTDMSNATRFTTMSFSAVPSKAASELCRTTANKALSTP
jgi:hypothetical protein